MRSLSLVEEYITNEANFGDQIIALTPMAMYGLDKLGLAYKIPEDYYVWKENENHKADFFKWLEDLNLYLKKEYYPYFVHSSFHNIPFSYHFFAMLKSVYDNFTRVGLTVQKILDEYNPDKIIFLTDYQKEIYDDELFFKGRSLYRRFFSCLIPPDCDMRFYHADSEEKKVTNWRDNFVLRRLYDIFRYWMWLPSLPYGRKYLFASTMPEVRNFKFKGKRVEFIWKGPKLSGNIKYSHKIPESLMSNFFGYPSTRTIIHPVIKYFVNVIVRKVLIYADYYWLELGEIKPDCVIFNRRNKLYQYGLLIAAKKRGIKTAYFKHGWEGYDFYHEDYRRLKMYDVVITKTKDEEEYFKSKKLCEVI